MTETVEFLLSEKITNKIAKPYLAMSKEEKAELEKFRDMYSTLSNIEMKYMREHGDMFSFAKLDAFRLESDLNYIISEISLYLSANGRFFGDFGQLKEFCLVNNLNFDEFFGNLYEELNEVLAKREHGEDVPLYKVECFKKCANKFFELSGDETREEHVANCLKKEYFDEIDANLLKLSGVEIDKLPLTEQQRLTFLMSTSKNAIAEFLQSKPEKLVYNDSQIPKKGALFNYLNKEQRIKLFEMLNDDVYESRLILSSDIAEISQISYLFPQLDRYMQTQIVCSKHKYKVQNIELAEEKIKHYAKVRSTLLELPEEERAQFLANLEGIETEELEGVGSYRDNNEIKKSLLEYLRTQEERNLVVESLQRSIDPRLEFYVETAEKIIEDFFESHGGLNEQEKERMRSTLKSMDFKVEHYEKASKRGCTYHLKHYISISEDCLTKPNATMFYLLHEMTHAMSAANFRQMGHHCGKTFEEGMADTFAQIALSEYIRKYGELEKNGKNISVENIKFVAEDTTCKFENGLIRSMLYVLQQQGMDYDGIRTFLLGNKSDFFEMVMGNEFCKGLDLDFNGEPMKEPMKGAFNYRDFYDVNSRYLQKIDKTSTYYDVNFILPAFVIQERFGHKPKFGKHMVEVLQQKDVHKNKNFINIIFDGRKLYEVSYEEYEEFSQLYKQANLAKKNKQYIKEKVKYIKSKYSELKDKEIEEHGMEIVGALAGLLQDTTEDFDISTERGLNKTLLKAIRAAKSQARLPEMAQEASKLYENLHSMNRKSFKNEALEVILEAFEGFEEDLGEYVKRNQSKTFGAQLIEAVQHEGVSLEEIGEAGIEFDRDMAQGIVK